MRRDSIYKPQVITHSEAFTLGQHVVMKCEKCGVVRLISEMYSPSRSNVGWRVASLVCIHCR